MKQNEFEDIEIIDEDFDNLQECVDYYTDILASLKEGYENDLYTKREYKQKKKFIMEQFNANLKVIKKVDKHSRNTTIKHLKQPKIKKFKSLKTDESIKRVTPGESQYQIEDKKEQFDEEDKN